MASPFGTRYAETVIEYYNLTIKHFFSTTSAAAADHVIGSTVSQLLLVGFFKKFDKEEKKLNTTPEKKFRKNDRHFLFTLEYIEHEKNKQQYL